MLRLENTTAHTILFGLLELRISATFFRVRWRHLAFRCTPCHVFTLLSIYRRCAADHWHSDVSGMMLVWLFHQMPPAYRLPPTAHRTAVCEPPPILSQNSASMEPEGSIIIRSRTRTTVVPTAARGAHNHRQASARPCITIIADQNY